MVCIIWFLNRKHSFWDQDMGVAAVILLFYGGCFTYLAQILPEVPGLQVNIGKCFEMEVIPWRLL